MKDVKTNVVVPRNDSMNATKTGVSDETNYVDVNFGSTDVSKDESYVKVNERRGANCVKNYAMNFESYVNYEMK